jgi:hypothetical protein
MISALLAGAALSWGTLPSAALEGGPAPGFAFSSTLEYLDVPAR